MNGNDSFSSVLGPVIASYIDLKQALGRHYAGERRILASLDIFLAKTGSDLTAGSFSGWCTTQEHLASGVRRYRMRVIRNFTLYRRRLEPSCFVPDSLLFPPLHQPVQPYIFTHAQIAKLVELAASLERSRDCPVRPEVFTLAITLLYTTGLRRGELLRMTIGDYDVGEQTLLVQESKFHKSRLLPLSADGVLQLDRYLEARRTRCLPSPPDTPLIWNHRCGGRAYSATGFGHVIGQLLDMAGIRKPNGHLPRVHDFRHTFATHALLRWYLDGEDVHNRLPFLATYMGHVSIVSTQYYLQLIEPLVSSASQRFAQRYGGLIQPLPTVIGGGS
ncbi:tyrosine-type recombinase/integrase [Desulfosarcina ovata]|uniref:tyrosine-type recombinase/integrase n=1 Tax=Desulfosarcina ovata TaxID=83564 RepID=UPI0012D2C289|nr:tyrosine-type recombinase/integrase [Desulfosarcina ovata]